jgi:hypothetical protein
MGVRIEIENVHLPGTGFDQTGHQLQECGFARTFEPE